MKTASLFCAVAVAAAFAGPADAIYKCSTTKGVVYQDQPCREGSETGVQIVIPTGEPAPRSTAASADGVAADGVRGDNRPAAPKRGRADIDDPTFVAKPADSKSREAAANGVQRARQKEAQAGAEKPTAPLTAEQARKTDPSAKYFATEAFGPGNETPTQMNCESPTGEKRVFYLSNGKLTSI